MNQGLNEFIKRLLLVLIDSSLIQQTIEGLLNTVLGVCGLTVNEAKISSLLLLMFQQGVIDDECFLAGDPAKRVVSKCPGGRRIRAFRAWLDSIGTSGLPLDVFDLRSSMFRLPFPKDHSGCCTENRVG